MHTVFNLSVNTHKHIRLLFTAATMLNPTAFLTQAPLPELNNPKWKTKALSISNHPCLDMLENCKNMKTLKQIHAQMIRLNLTADPFSVSRIVAFCAISDHGSIDYAHAVFLQIPEPNTFMKNTVIRGYAGSRAPVKAVELYKELQEKGGNSEFDHHSFTFLLKACSRLGCAELGKEIHGRTIKIGLGEDVYIQNALVHMYSSCGEAGTARQVFDKRCVRDLISWNTIIHGYVQEVDYAQVFDLFERMEEEGVEPDGVTMVGLLAACGLAGDLQAGKRFHGRIKEMGLEVGVVLQTALVDMYSKCGCLGSARDVFDKMPDRNVVSWNAMLGGYALSRMSKEILSLFQCMLVENKVRPNEVTMLSVLSACADLGSLQQGQWAHLYMERNEIPMDEFVQTALIDMYSKCGSLGSAHKAFEKATKKDVSVWTAMINGLAMHGCGEEALELFQEMQREGIKANEITFVGVLCACSHSGLVNQGRSIFQAMSRDYGIEPNLEHYACMVDLLGRVGLLEEAEEFIMAMPVEPNKFVWGALLGGCRIHGNFELAKRVGRKVIELDPLNGGVYVLRANMYCATGQWEDSVMVRKMMKDSGIKKPLGCTMIEVDGLVHEFGAGDWSHPRARDIYLMLAEMSRRIATMGYKSDTSKVFLDLEEEEKENALGMHSEKLAIAFGLISSRPGEVIRMVKNLRVCGDCHHVSKLISKVFTREIIVRDRARFHHFKDGSCSCKDYW